LLCTESYGGSELDFPTAGVAIQEEKIRNSGFTVIEIGGLVTVREAVWLGAVQWVVGAEDKAEVLGADQVFGNTMVGEPELLTRIMDISSQDAHWMRQVGSGPNREVDEFDMVSPHFRYHFLRDGTLPDATGSRHRTQPAHAGVSGHRTTVDSLELLMT